MTEAQEKEIQKLKADVFDILERIELHQLEIQKLDQIRKNVVTQLGQLRSAANAERQDGGEDKESPSE